MHTWKPTDRLILFLSLCKTVSHYFRRFLFKFSANSTSCDSYCAVQLKIFWDVYWIFLKFQLILDNLIANSIFLDTLCFLLNKHAEKSFIHLKIHSKLQKNLKKRVEVCPKIKLNLWWTSCVCRKAAFILSFFLKFYISRLTRSLFLQDTKY